MKCIVAVSTNGVIGSEDKLPWHLPVDLKRFKNLTTGHSIVLGRKTFESFPGPLPDRYHYVITRHPEDYVDSSSVLHLTESEARCLDLSYFWLVGGAQIYSLFADVVEELYLTTIHRCILGDTHFPWSSYSSFSFESGGEVKRARNGIYYSYSHFKRKES